MDKIKLANKLLGIIKSSEASVSSRFYAINLLSKIPNLKNNEIIEILFTKNYPWPLKFAGVKLIHSQQSENKIVDLLNIIQNDEEELVRLEAVRNLKTIIDLNPRQNEIDTELLFKILHSEESYLVNSEVIKLLNSFPINKIQIDILCKKIIRSMNIFTETDVKHELFLKAISEASSSGIFDTYVPSGLVNKEKSINLDNSSYREYATYLDKANESLAEAWSSITVLSKRMNSSIFNTFNEVLLRNKNGNNLDSGTAEELAGSTFLELIGTIIIWECGNNKDHHSKKLLKDIALDKRQKKNLRRLSRWQEFKNLGEFSFFRNNKSIGIKSHFSTNISKAKVLKEKIEIDNSSPNSQKDFFIVDTNIRNRLAEISLDDKLKSIELYWGLKVHKYQIIGGSTGTIKLEVLDKNNSNCPKFFYFKNISDSFQSAKYVAEVLSFFLNNTNLPVSRFIPTVNNNYIVKLGNFYYSIEEEYYSRNSKKPSDIVDSDFFNIGELASFIHKSTENSSFNSFKKERPSYDFAQWYDFSVIFDNVLDGTDSKSLLELNEIEKVILQRYKLSLENINKLSYNFYSAFIIDYEPQQKAINSLVSDLNWKKYGMLNHVNVHFDLSWNNVIMSDNEIKFVFDWNKVGWMPFIEDIKNSVMNHSLGRIFDPLAILNFLQGYSTNYDLDRNAIKLLLNIIQSTYIAANHDHLHIAEGKNNDPHLLLPRRKIYNKVMNYYLTKERDGFELILNKILDLPKETKIVNSPLSKSMNINKKEILASLMSIKYNELNDNSVNLNTMRQMIDEENIVKVRETFEGNFFNKNLDSNSNFSLSMGLSIFGNLNTAKNILKKIVQTKNLDKLFFGLISLNNIYKCNHLDNKYKAFFTSKSFTEDLIKILDLGDSKINVKVLDLLDTLISKT